MFEFRSTWGKRALAGMGALTLAAAGMLGGSAAASAAPSFGNIDETADGSIIIHKHKHQVGTDAVQNPAGDGAAIPSAGIAGVVFTAYRITDLDLTDPAVWDNLDQLDPAGVCDLPDNTLGTGIVSAATDAAGLTTINAPAIGAYLVCETSAPDDVVERALPFVVTIPFPWQDGWLYDVNVYPKNGTSSITKTITPQTELGLGSVVSFPVTTEVPAVRPDGSLANYVISDTLDPRLTPAGIASITVDGVAVPATYYDVDTAGQTISVTFNADGLEWLKSQAQKKIITTFKGTVVEVGSGTITNEAVVLVNDHELTSNEVTTNWGDVKVLKTDVSTPAVGLAGAEFEVYNAVAPYGDCAAAVSTGTALSVETAGDGGQTVFTSNAAGLVYISGLFVSDSVNPVINATERCYVLKEIKAPAGFITPTGTAAFTPVAVKTGMTAEGTYDVTITNTQQDVPELPLTGANGQMIMIAGGSAVLLISVGLVLVNRRRASASDKV
jgi:fimbrial isopeptide formation D2 family protein/LPXTG-motif cell wall-anchored protein